jgi:hypothetical protein
VPKAPSDRTWKRGPRHIIPAIAAWNQVVRHGQSEVGVRGALRSARLIDVQAYRDGHLAPRGRVLVCLIGGVGPQTLRPALEKRLGGIASTAKGLPPATSKPGTPRQRSATWDLGATHYIETYAIPGSDYKDYAAIYLTAMLLNQSLFMDQTLKPRTGTVFCGADLTTPEQGYFYVSASLKPGADAAEVARQVRRHLAGFKQPQAQARVAMVAAALSGQMSAPADLAAVMRHRPAHATEAIVLGNLGLQWGLLEFQHGQALPALAKALAGVSAGDVASVVDRYLSASRRDTLTLVPKG